MRMRNIARRGSRRGGFLSFEVILTLIIVGIALGFIFLNLYPKLRTSMDANTFKGEYSLIEQGLSQYYSNNYKYPSGSGWNWDSANAYVEQAIKNKGWQYSCSGGTITITTPPIDNAKTRQKLKESFSKTADAVNENGNTLDIQLYNKYCP